MTSPTIDLAQLAPTQEALDTVIARQRTLVLFNFWVLVTGVVVVVISLTFVDRPADIVSALDHGRYTGAPWTISYGSVCGFAMAYQALAFLMYLLVPSRVSPVTPTLNAEIDAYCAASQLAHQYVTSVRSQGRPVTLAEFGMLRKAAANTAARVC